MFLLDSGFSSKGKYRRPPVSGGWTIGGSEGLLLEGVLENFFLSFLNVFLGVETLIEEEPVLLLLASPAFLLLVEIT